MNFGTNVTISVPSSKLSTWEWNNSYFMFPKSHIDRFFKMVCSNFFVHVKNICTKTIHYIETASNRFNVWLGERQFFVQTTIHPLSQISSKTSPGINFCWIAISLLTICVSCMHIRSDVLKMFSSQYSVNMKLPTQGHSPSHMYHICYHHWALWVDFEKAYNKFNLTKHELLTLLAPLNNDFHAYECPAKRNYWEVDAKTPIWLQRDSLGYVDSAAGFNIR